MTIRSENAEFGVFEFGPKRHLRVISDDPNTFADFEGSTGSLGNGYCLEGPVSSKNAQALRNLLTWLSPRPVGVKTSAGVGDRLGISTHGHALAFINHGQGISPFFAQQSIREMDRLERSPQSVLDDATFGCVSAGWYSPVGADADHLKTTQEIDRCLAAGFTTFTLDPGDSVVRMSGPATPEQIESIPWNTLEDTPDAMMRRYEALNLDFIDIPALEQTEILKAAVKYGAAVAKALQLYRHLLAAASHEVEVEIAVDETDEPTSLFEHIYMATEMRRLGMQWVSFAPRFIGDFEKGVEYKGNIAHLAESLRQHRLIADALGPYKLSLHSGSDKFSIYQMASETLGPMVHLKTSGTTYLEALRVIAQLDPNLFVEIYSISYQHFKVSKKSYPVSAEISTAPDPQQISGTNLLDILSSNATRQILHVGYGDVLRSANGGGETELAIKIRSLLEFHSEEYGLALERHIGKHLSPFSIESRGANEFH